ncbi:MAG: prolipoprotein diacylglyceryl transferase [Lachnospiraceae bacterium]|nr:prolipoprotein diacylglyceryl transferase [Lachnospiraceae bacterium]
MPDIMGATDIAFPNLGIYLTNVPKSFSIFGFPIAFYGLIIGIGVLCGVLVAAAEAKHTGQNPDNYWDFAIYAIIFSIIGARIYYVVFAWDLYKDDLLSIFNTRRGGLAIYGAVIAAFLTLFIYTRVKKLSFFQMGDTAMMGLILGQVIGRWGNFMNRECFGQYTDGLFAMRLPVEAVRSNEISASIAEHMSASSNYIQVHPTFLYESLWNLALLLIIFLYRDHKKFHGEICLIYLGGYGLGRFWIEGLRTDQLQIGSSGIAVSQMLAAFLVLFAITTFIVVRIQLKKKI